MPLLPAKLRSSAGAELPADAAIPVDPGGTVLALEIPANSELLAVALTIVAPADDRTIDLLAGPQAAALASSQGPGAPPSNLAVAWLTADWRTRRPLSALTITVSGQNPALLGLLKLSEDGPWYPPSPSRLTLGAPQRLPALLASRLMVEFVSESGGVQTPASAIVTGVAVQAAARPGDLILLLADTPVASHALAFDPRESWRVDADLLLALQTALADRGGPVQLRLRSSETGLLHRLALTLDRVPRVREFVGGPAVTGAVAADDRTTFALAAPADALVEQLACTLRVAFPRERPAVPVDTDPPGPHAHRVTPDRSAAQAFTHAPGAALVGLDLHLRPLAPILQLSLSIHPDQHGEPAPPLLTVPLERVIDGDPPWPSDWHRFDLPAPLALPDGPWWAVLSVSRGDVLWHLDTRPLVDAPGAPRPRSARWRHGADAWLPREVPGPGPVRSLVVPWARTRVRLAADDTTAPAPVVHLLYRGAELLLTPDPDGRITVPRDRLAALAARPPAPLAIRVASTVAGTVTLADLELRLAPVRDTLALGLP